MCREVWMPFSWFLSPNSTLLDYSGWQYSSRGLLQAEGPLHLDHSRYTTLSWAATPTSQHSKTELGHHMGCYWWDIWQQLVPSVESKIPGRMRDTPRRVNNLQTCQNRHPITCNRWQHEGQITAACSSISKQKGKGARTQIRPAIVRFWIKSHPKIMVWERYYHNFSVWQYYDNINIKPVN